MFAIATVRVLRTTAGILAVFLALAVPLALVFPGDRSFWQAYIYWALAIPGVLVFWFALESLGTWAVDRPSINRLSSAARIGVVVVGLILILVTIIGVFEIVKVYAF